MDIIDMENIRIITNKNELQGTCYIEVMAGAYKNKCWNEGSLFFEEEVFMYIETIIKRHHPKYDHYAFTEIKNDDWLAITNDFDKLRSLLSITTSISQLNNHIGFLFNDNDTSEQFAKNLQANKDALSHLLSDFSAWIRLQINAYDSLTILGI